MKIKSVAALGAILLLALGTTVADARHGNGGGGGGGGGGGPRFSGGGGGGGSHFGGGGGNFRSGNFSGRSFRSGQNFGAANFRGHGSRIGDRGYRNFAGNYYGHGGRGHHHRRGRFLVGYPYYSYGYYDDGYYGYDCEWLYRRAIETGSPYWWRRYQNCDY